MVVLRSMLFIPGNNMRMIHKIKDLDADAYILDLEDAVPLLEKETARYFIEDGIEVSKAMGATTYVRVNALTTGLTADDVKTVTCKGLDGIMLAKTESASDVVKVEKLIEKAESEKGLHAGGVAIVPLIETAKGVLDTYQIATASGRIVAVSFGAVDFTRDMGTNLTPAGSEIFFARSQIALASRAAGVQAIDTVYIDISNLEDLRRDSEFAKGLGFKGKMLIHPRQIPVVNDVFSPASGEVEYSRKVVEAFKEAEEKGLGAISLDGKMIDIANYRQAQDVLAFASAIAERGKKTVE